MNNKIKIIALVLFMFVVFYFASCNSEEVMPNNSDDVESTVNIIEKNEDVESVNNAIKNNKIDDNFFDNIKITDKMSDNDKVENTSRIVYVTPYGKKYHYKSTCAGKNAQETKQNLAENFYEPCLKCAS